MAACTGSAQGELTGAPCPTTNVPTYSNFGQAFFQSYCLDCEAQTKTGAARNGAPVTIDFDTRSLRMDTSGMTSKRQTVRTWRTG